MLRHAKSPFTVVVIEGQVVVAANGDPSILEIVGSATVSANGDFAQISEPTGCSVVSPRCEQHTPESRAMLCASAPYRSGGRLRDLLEQCSR